MTTRLQNQHWQSFSGEPITGRTPPQTRVMNDVPMNTLQAAGVAHAYKLFTDAVLVTPGKYLTQDRVLQDGTRVRLVSNQGIDVVMVWPVGGGQTDSIFSVAYPVYYDLSFCPVFTRVVYDAGPATSTDPPVYEPFRDYVPLVIPEMTSYGLQFLYGPPPQNFTVAYEKEAIFVSVFLGAVSKTTMGTFPCYTAFYGNTPDRGVELIAPGARLHITGQTGDPGFNDDTNSYYQAGAIFTFTKAAFGQPIVKNFDINDTYEGLFAPIQAENNAIFEAYQIAEAAAQAAYVAARTAYNAAYYESLAAWTAGNAGGSAGPAPLSGLRTAGRATQITALKNFLNAGIQPPHLMARNLALPFNIGTKPKLTLAITGSLVTATVAEADATGKYFTVTATDVMHLTPPVSFGRDVAQSTGLFSWKATGTLQLYQNYSARHAYEKDEVRPPNLSTLTFTERAGYTAFANGGFIRDAAAALDLTINSDAYLPPRTSVLIVHYEYEAFDSYTNAWVWTPCVELFSMDSIWIKSLGDYSLPALASQSSMTPRALRIRTVTKQKRKPDWTWTAAVALAPSALPSGWDASQSITSSWQRDFYPSAVAVITNMDNAAKPIAGGTTLFPFGAKHLWSGNPKAINEALQQPWATATKIEQIVAHALKNSRGKL